MDMIVLIVAAATALLIGHLIFGVVRRYYRLHGKLTLPISLLQPVAIAQHAVIGYIGLLESEYPVLPDSAAQTVAGLLSGSFGLIVLVWGFVNFGPIGRAFGIRTDSLKTSGVYRWSRNPQIVGYCLFLLGWVIIWPSEGMFIALLVCMGLVHQMVRVEERHLGRIHGEEYARYRERTARYLGFPGKIGR